MYSFKDFKQRSTDFIESPHQLIYDGMNIDEELTTDTTSFTTLIVSGRGMSQRKHLVDEQDGIDGSAFETVNYLPRTLNVKARVSATSNTAFRGLMERLNLIFSGRNEVEIKFSDETHHYIGHYLSSSQPEEVSNEQVIEFEFYCGNPFKYTDKKTLVIENGATLTGLETDYPVKPVINFKYAEGVKDVTITNTLTSKVLYVNASSTTTEFLVELDLSISENRNIFGLISRNNLRHLSLNSDLADFTLSKRDRLVIQPAPSEIKLSYRGVKL